MKPTEFAFVPRYIEQMMLAASVTLLKILNSFYAKHVDTVNGKTQFTRAVAALRTLSVRGNDLPQRLAEVMAQLWISCGGGDQDMFNTDPTAMTDTGDNSLSLKVRCRSSLSVLYDAIWRWRERAGQVGRDNLVNDIQHPTSLSETTRNTPQPGHNNSLADVHLTQPSSGLPSLAQSNDIDALNWDQTFGGNAVFDPLSWALDGNIMGLTNPLFGPNDGMGMAGYQG